MPYYRRRYKRKYTRKPRRGWWKRKQRKYTGQMGRRFFKIKQVSGATANFAGFIVLDLPARDASGAQDWSNIAGLFDSYRVCATKIKYIPSLPNDTSSVTGFYPMYIAMDSDSTSIPVSTVNQIIQYENMKVFNMYRPWSYYTKVPKTCQTGADQGYVSTATPLTNGRVFGIGENFDVNTSYGTIIQTYYLSCKNRK